MARLPTPPYLSPSYPPQLPNLLYLALSYLYPGKPKPLSYKLTINSLGIARVLLRLESS